MLQQENVPEEIATILALQSSIGQWQLSRRLYAALGHTFTSIPIAPQGVKDWRWATALAVIFLRRRPDLIDFTYDAYSQAIGWVDESILAEAHKRLPPPNLYYPVDTEASRQGRWLEQTGEALEECGYAYFLKTETTKSQEEDKENYKDNTPNQELKASIFKPFSSVENYIIDAQEAKTEISASQAPQSLGKSKAGRSLTCGRPGAASRHDETADRDVVEQWHGLRRELKRAIREARTIFKEGDRVESRWRRPTRLDKPRVDRGTWHPGYIVTANKDGKVELVFEDGEEEHLNAVPAKHVRLAPSPEYSKCPDVTSSQKQIDTSSSVDLCSASRRELSHIVSATKILRRTWDNPLRMDQELARLRGLWEEKMRSRPEWRVSFPAVSFETTKRLPIASGVAGGFCQSRDGKQRQHPKVANRRSKKRSQTSLSISGTPPELAETNEEDQRHNEVDHHGNTWDTLGITSSLRLIEAQSNLVAAAMAYDKCVAELRNTLDRGVSTFRAARTYSEQQSAFAEATAALGPSQPAQAGYSDWRGRRVVGLQSATLDAVEALDAWAVEWKAAKDEAAGADFHNVVGQSGTDGINAVVEAPPFLWEGSPLASTIIGHSAAILSRAPELKGWYGPGFPARTNPFFLAYPIEGRPVTPRNALVQAYVNGEMVTTISPMLLEKREQEETALEEILGKQASAPSWWPATQGAMNEEHFARIRRAEKKILQEERRGVARPSRSSPEEAEVVSPRN